MIARRWGRWVGISRAATPTKKRWPRRRNPDASASRAVPAVACGGVRDMSSRGRPAPPPRARANGLCPGIRDPRPADWAVIAGRPDVRGRATLRLLSSWLEEARGAEMILSPGGEWPVGPTGPLPPWGVPDRRPLYDCALYVRRRPPAGVAGGTFARRDAGRRRCAALPPQYPPLRRTSGSPAILVPCLVGAKGKRV